MWKTVLFLLFTLLIVPLVTFQFDEPLNGVQYETLIKLTAIYLVAAGLCFVVSTLSKNYSQVDKLWSIMPVIYAWVVAYDGEFESRLVLMASLVTLWGIRLTLNFARRGGYSWKFWEGDEDYRWAVLQAKPEFQASWKWVLFNLFFISLYQMGLILLFTLPILKSMGGTPLAWPDFLLAGLMIALVFVEMIADNQQWRFQNDKRLQLAGSNPAPEYKKGFIEDGLWGIVRHPNYAAEQAIWVVFYLFSAIATGLWINWSIAGCLLLMLLFKGSSDFSEGISEGKYPEYKDYQKRVPRFVPIPKGKKEAEPEVA